MTRIAINGFGRIGRSVLRRILQDSSVQVVAINDLDDPATLVHLLKYDSVHGNLPYPVQLDGDVVRVKNQAIKLLKNPKPAELPWKQLQADIVLECTGRITEKEPAMGHIAAGAKKVLISAPSKDADLTVCIGINHTQIKPDHTVISNASCTTNCLAPVAKVLDETYGIVRGVMTTVHSYTNDQRVLDLPHKDLRRARAAAVNMIPSSTGAAKAIGLVLPQLKGKLDGIAVRVPTPNVSLVDLTVELKKSTTKQEMIAALTAAAQGPLKGILQVVEEELVSSDFNGSPFSSSVDAPACSVLDGTLAKVFAWYDNEMGYSQRLVDLANYVGKSLA